MPVLDPGILATFTNAQKDAYYNALKEVPTNGTFTSMPAGATPAPAPAPTKPVSIISTKTAASDLQNGQSKLNNISPSTNPIAPAPAATSTTGNTSTPQSNTSGTSTGSSAKQPDYIKLVNPETGQEQTYNNPDINKQTIQGLLKSGWSVSESNLSSPFDFGTTPGTAPKTQAEQDVAAAQAAIDAANAKYEQMKTTDDPATAALITSIQGKYGALISQMQDVNQRQDQSYQTLGYRIGGQYGAGGNSIKDLVSLSASNGVQRIAQLQGQEDQEIANARIAEQNQEWTQFNTTMIRLEAVRKEKQAALNDENKAAAELLAKHQEQAAQIANDNAVMDAFSSGVTNPVDIFKSLKHKGYSLTSKDIADTLKNIATDSGAGSIDKLSGDVRDFMILKGIPGGLPSEIAGLPAGQQMAAYVQWINQAKQDPLAREQKIASINASRASLGRTNLLNQSTGLQMQRTGQLLENARALEATRIVGSQIKSDNAIQNFLKVAPMMDRVTAAQEDIKNNGINQSNAADLLDAVTQLNTGGKQITEGQVGLTKDSQSYVDQLTSIFQKSTGQGGVITPKVAADAIRLSGAIFDLYQSQYKKRAAVYNTRLKNVNGQDLSAYSPLTDISNLEAVNDGTYQSALEGSVTSTGAQQLLDQPIPGDENGASFWDTAPE